MDNRKRAISKGSSDFKDILLMLTENIKARCDLKKAKKNCGFLAQAIINTLCDLLEGKKPSTDKITLKSSLKIDFAEIRYQQIAIKQEQELQIIQPDTGDGLAEYGIVTVEKMINIPPRPFHFQAIRNQYGLYSTLPIQEYTQINLVDEDDIREEKVIEDLNHGKVSLKKIEIELAEEFLKKESQKAEGVIVGHIALVRSKGKPFHLFAFCATPEEVYYIDGQDYKEEVGILFNSLKNDYKGFQAAFYLIHKSFPLEIDESKKQNVDEPNKLHKKTKS